jgi:hypothetical protein
MASLVTRLMLVATVFGGIAVAAPAGVALAGGSPADPQVSAFVIGDGSLAAGPTVEYWGAQWAKDNMFLNGSDAPNSFKGFADTTTVAATGCTGSFTTVPGNSSEPPSTVPAIVYVLVANSVTKAGPVISGTYVDIVAVATDPGYGPDPGHPGTGLVLGSICGGGGSPS